MMLALPLAVLLAAGPQQAEKVSIPDHSYDFEVVRVPGGKLALDGRAVELKPFWMARTEATWEQFSEYFARRERTKVDGLTRPSAPYEPPNGDMGVGKHCAVGMRRHSAVGFCAWLTQKTGQKFRLPTEAEWEHGARAGSTAAGPDAPDAAAWHAGNSGKKTQIVGKKDPNAFGLHDMMGNVWEYCLEDMTPGDYAPVIRGGAWNTPPGELRFGTRQPIKPEWFERDPNRPRSMWWLTDARFMGFRVVRMGDAVKQDAQKAYLSKVEVRDLKQGEARKTFMPITGEIVNGGDQTLWEVEVTVFFLDSAGKPILEDEKARATFEVVYPVLVNSWHSGAHAAPLKPGESRKFAVVVPEAFEIAEIPEKAGAKVTGVRFAD